MSNGIKTLEAADNGLKSVMKTVESLQSAIRQARQDKSWQGASYAFTATSGTATSSSPAVRSAPPPSPSRWPRTRCRRRRHLDQRQLVADGKVRASNDNGKLRVENLSTSTLTVTDTAVATNRHRRHDRRQHGPRRPDHAVQRPAPAARPHVRGCVLQRHQPAARRLALDHLQRDRLLFDHHPVEGRQGDQLDQPWHRRSGVLGGRHR